MTRHNLDEHLSWLLHTKATLPAETTSLPPASISFTPVDPSQPAPDETRVGQTLHVEGIEPSPARLQRKEEMVRVRTTPASASRQDSTSLGPRVPDTERSKHVISGARTGRPVADAANSQLAIRQTPRRHDDHVSGSRSNVEIMDLTESLSQMASPTPARVAGRKRKSSELDADPSSKPCPRHGRSIRPEPMQAPPRASQQSFTAIEEIINEPADPPPPYSTLAPRHQSPIRRSTQHINAAPTRSSSTLSAGHGRALPDSEDDGDDDLVNLTGRATKRKVPYGETPPFRRAATMAHVPDHLAEVPLLHTSAPESHVSHNGNTSLDAMTWQTAPEKPTPNYDGVAAESMAGTALPASSNGQMNRVGNSETLRRFFALSDADTRKLVNELQTRRENLCDAVAELMDDDPTAADELDREVDELDRQCAAIEVLAKKRCDHQRLLHEKDQLYAAMRSAIKARQGKKEACDANSAGKVKLQEFEIECVGILGECQDNVDAFLGSEEPVQATTDHRAIAVQSTQAHGVLSGFQKPPDPSSSRIAQTQVVKQDYRQPAKRPPQSKAMAPEISPTNIEAYFSPSRKQAREVSHGRKSAEMARDSRIHTNDDAFDDDLRDEDMIATNGALFSNRMGTPPAPFDLDEEDDFGMHDDDGMLDFAEDIENQGFPTQKPYSNASRTVFAETSGNSQTQAGVASANKPKRAITRTDDPNLEELFRFPWSDDVKRTLKERFRLRGFRQNQLQSINATLSGRDTFVLMPTGGGKSLCYQLPSLISSGKTRGVTIIISPLLSLMEDQVQHLRRLNIQAFLINGETSREEKNSINQALREHTPEKFIQLLYVTPEMLSKNQYMISIFEQLHQRQKLARLVIDEAHCVSQWGHDFRPDYKAIGDVRRKFPGVPVMALTATATENVKVDVIHNLAIDGCEVYTQSFNRPNLYYEVRGKAKGKEDIRNIASLIKEKHPKQTGIIYCFSRKNCEDIAKALRDDHKIKAHHYHAGMEAKEKSEVQKQWQAGKYHVIVATIAFGMGIDKADVRFVVHHSIPKTLEGYYQETGRAGRDSKKSACYLFYGYQDAGKLRRMIDESTDASWEQKQRQHHMLRKMIQYCENKSDCRRVQVLGYFSEAFHRNQCDGQCDNCNSTASFQDVDFTDYAQQAINIVRQITSDKVTVLHCIDVFRGASNKKVKDLGHDNLEEYGAGTDLDRGDIERLFYRLLTEDAIHEDNVVNKAGFATQYAALGRNCGEYRPGRKRLQMQIRTTPRPKAQPPKKKSKKSAENSETKVGKKAARSMAPPDLPLSTNVSSPIQAASKRKNANKAGRSNAHSNGYERDNFVVSDPEDYDYDETEDDDFGEAFEPVRNAGQPLRDNARQLGPPITSDATMDSLDEIHRDIVGEFVQKASKKVQDIMLKRSLRAAPFTELMLRQMAIYFTETKEDMKRISGINAEKVDLYGQPFCELVKKTRAYYQDMMGWNDDGPDPDARNVIDLVSASEDESEDEYGSLDESEDEDDGQPSAYFHPTGDVQAFNERFALSQSAAMRSAAAASQPAEKKKGQWNNRRKTYKATGGNGTGTKRRFAGRSRNTSNSYEGGGQSSRVTKKSSKKRSTGNGARGSTARGGSAYGGNASGRGGGISIMPT